MFLRFFLTCLVAVCFADAVRASDSNSLMSGYMRDRWGAERGFPGGPVYAIAQTPDGYLWLGTEKGLVRFDGLSFRLFSPTNSTALLAGPILDLMTDGDGNLWIRPQSRNIFRYRDGVLQDIMPGLDSARLGVTAMCRGPKGEALFAVRGVGIFLYHKGKFEKLMSTDNLPNFIVISLAETGDGKVWMGTRDTGLFFISDGQLSDVIKGLPDKKVNSLLAANNRELWIGTDNGVVRRGSGETIEAGGAGPLSHIQTLAMAGDHKSNIWIGASSGLLRLNSGGVPSLDENDLGAVNAVFEDREGNIWVGSTQGIDRFRITAFVTYSVSIDHPSQGNGAVFIEADDRIWFAPSDGGLFWRKGAQTGEVKNDGLDRDVVYSMTGGNGELWLGRQHGGLTHLVENGGAFTTQTYTQASGLARNTIYSVHQSRDGTVWAGSISGGLTRFSNGKFTTYTDLTGLTANTVTSILESSDGTMWFGTRNGLSSLLQNNWTVYRSADGLPPGTVNSLLEDTSGAIWIGTDNGIAVLRSGQIQVPGQMPEQLRGQILGIARDRNGALWISTANHVLRVDGDKLLGGTIGEADLREFGFADGLRSVEGVKRHRSVVTDPAGRIWFSTIGGLSVVDPGQFSINSAPAIAHIEGLTADSSVIDLQRAVRLAGGHQRITFSYAGLSFSVPERIRYKYRLDSFDHDWSQPVAVREVAYTNLGPGRYLFHVMASNSDGLWNGVESTIPFEIEPVLWQTWWFRLSGLTVCGLVVLFLYRYRLLRLARQLNMRFEERLAERTRIAQDLHDTLLQGFLSASMQLHVANDQLPVDWSAKPMVGRVLELMGQVLEEGRRAVSGLRASNSNTVDLEQAFSRIPQELGIEQKFDFRVIVEGKPRPLHPVIRDEVYRIGREALVNAFRHSQAKSIEIELEYVAKHLQVIVRDDGCGIDDNVLQSGREGHWGLPGMRGRAEEIGAKLNVWSRNRSGTEVVLFVPGHIAFQSWSSNRRLRRLTGLYRRDAVVQDSKNERY